MFRIMLDFDLCTHAIFVWAMLCYWSSAFLEGFALEFGILVVSSGLVLVIVVVFGVCSFYLPLLRTVPLARLVGMVIWVSGGYMS